MWVAPLVVGLFVWLATSVEDKRWRRLWRALLGVLMWLTIWISIRYVAVAENKDDAVTWAARSILRGLSGLSEIMFSPWFVPALLFVLIFRTELKALVNRLVNSVKSMEAGGIKIELKEPESAPIALMAQWWADNPDPSDHVKDTPAGDGAMRVRPDRPTSQYLKAVEQIEDILSQVTTDNQMELGPQARNLEREWSGEYTEYLELTLNLLRQRLETKALDEVKEKYLATAFTLRHIMLYLHGDDDHAVQFMAHLQYLDHTHARGTLKHAMGYWFVLFLCERKHFEIARQLANHKLLATEPATAAAYKALVKLKSARYHQAIEIAAAGLKIGAQTPASKAILEYVLAQSYVRTDNPQRAIHFAELVMRNAEPKPYGLLNYLRRSAVRVYAYACTQTKKLDRLQNTVDTVDFAGDDPYVLEALAVALASDDQRKLAQETMKRALALLPAFGADALRKEIEGNLTALQAS